MKQNIVVVGSINMDLVVRAPRHPLPGETILGSDFRTFPGGKGANQAVAAARLGGDVTMIGRVGSDEFGDTLRGTLEKDNVDTSYVLRTEGVSSGVALITVSDAGQNNIVVVPGSNGKLSPADIHGSREAIEGAQVVLLQLEIPLDTVEEAVRTAKQAGATVILNPAPAQALPADLLAQVDILTPNESELSLLTGTDAVDFEEARRKLGMKSLIVTLGSNGVQVIEPRGTRHIAAHAVKAVDTTAAGDAFVGALAVALTQGMDLFEAAEWGNAAAAISVTRAGAQPSLPTRAEVEAILS